MKRITRVETQRKNAARRSIYIDDEFAFGVAEETYVRYSLVVDRTLDEAEIEEIVTFDRGYRARTIALGFVERRLRSEREIVEMLTGKEFDDETVSATLSFLREYGYADDRRFAGAYVNDRLMKRSISAGRLKSELQRKGVDREIAADVVAERVDEDAEIANAIRAAETRRRRLARMEPKAAERSLVNFLKSRGFGWRTIRTAVDATLKKDSESK